MPVKGVFITMRAFSLFSLQYLAVVEPWGFFREWLLLKNHNEGCMTRYCAAFDLVTKSVTLHNQSCRDYHDAHLLRTNRATDLGAHPCDTSALQAARESFPAIQGCAACCAGASLSPINEFLNTLDRLHAPRYE